MYKYVTKRYIFSKDKKFYFIDLLFNETDVISISVNEQVFNNCNLQMGDIIPDDSIKISYYKKGFDYIAVFKFE